MITIYGGSTSRSLRVVWLLEELGLSYRIRWVDLLKDEQDAGFLAANPAGFIPVFQEGDVTMVESIAIMEYLLARNGPTALVPAATDPAFAAYQQFLHLGEAGLATLMMPIIMQSFVAPPGKEGPNWLADQCKDWIDARMKLVSRQLATSPYLAGDAFTAADISVTYALELGVKLCGLELGATEQAYLARTTGRDAYKRAMERSEAVAE